MLVLSHVIQFTRYMARWRSHAFCAFLRRLSEAALQSLIVFVFALRRAPLTGQLAYDTTPSLFCQVLFSKFLEFFSFLEKRVGSRHQSTNAPRAKGHAGARLPHKEITAARTALIQTPAFPQPA